MVDLFPSGESERIFDINRIRNIDPSTRLRGWLDSSPKPYVGYFPKQDDLRVFFQETNFREDSFSRLVKDAEKTQITFDQLEKRHWDKIDSRLRKPPNQAIKNSVVRTVYKLKDNVFLTKMFFTFGLTHVKKGEKHVYTSNSPIMVCYLTDDRRRDCRASSQHRRSFFARDWKLYNNYVLRPHITYYIPEEVSYIIVTLKNGYFGVNIVAAEADISNALYFMTQSYDANPYPLRHREPLFRTPSDTENPSRSAG